MATVEPHIGVPRILQWRGSRRQIQEFSCEEGLRKGCMGYGNPPAGSRGMGPRS